VLSGDELVESYKFIIGFINEHFKDVVKTSGKSKTNSKTKFDYNKYV
jgi:hypothetical protein